MTFEEAPHEVPKLLILYSNLMHSMVPIFLSVSGLNSM
jgi:hypothetical protein